MYSLFNRSSRSRASVQDKSLSETFPWHGKMSSMAHRRILIQPGRRARGAENKGCPTVVFRRTNFQRRLKHRAGELTIDPFKLAQHSLSTQTVFAICYGCRRRQGWSNRPDAAYAGTDSREKCPTIEAGLHVYSHPRPKKNVCLPLRRGAIHVSDATFSFKPRPFRLLDTAFELS